MARGSSLFNIAEYPEAGTGSWPVLVSGPWITSEFQVDCHKVTSEYRVDCCKGARVSGTALDLLSPCVSA